MNNSTSTSRKRVIHLKNFQKNYVMMFIAYYLAYVCLWLPNNIVESFIILSSHNSCSYQNKHKGNPSKRVVFRCRMMMMMMNETVSGESNNINYYQGDFENDGVNEDDEVVVVGNGDWDTPYVVLEDLNWRIEKLRLEEANKKRFLTSGPRFLPYEECRKWVQAWGGRWDNQQEWQEWIEMGEKRNSYIPANPESYYTKLGQWISWDHFLGKIDPTTNTNTTNE